MTCLKLLQVLLAPVRLKSTRIFSAEYAENIALVRRKSVSPENVDALEARFDGQNVIDR